MRTLTAKITGARRRGVAVRRLLEKGSAVSMVLLVSVPMMAGSGGAVSPRRGTVPLDYTVGVPVKAQALQVPPISVRQGTVEHSKGTPKLSQSAFAHPDIPAAALLAYRRAADVIGRADESCGLSWTLLAAIGRVETDHGRDGGARLRSDGTSSPVIRGVTLDGTGPVARIRDTDGGRLDGSSVWDRAVGPMQFLPSTWAVVGVDADGDSVRSPDDLNDAALAAAVFLCGSPGDLRTRSGRRHAIFRYNPSDGYVASVLAMERSYRAGEFDTPGQLPRGDAVGIVAVRSDHAVGGQPETGHADSEPATGAGSGLEQHGQHGHGPTVQPPAGPNHPFAHAPGADPTGPHGSDPTGGPGPAGPPDAGPTPTLEPAPALAPAPVELTGVLTTCGSGWCLDELPLDVGDPAFLATTAGGDVDADGVVESNNDELTGLAGSEVRVLVVPDTAPVLVLAVNEVAYVVG